MNKQLALALTGLLAIASVDAFACEYVQGEYAEYFRCVSGKENVEVVSFTTQAGITIDCIYQRQDYRAPKLKAVTFTDDGGKQDDTCGRIGSVCDSSHQACDATLEAQ